MVVAAPETLLPNLLHAAKVQAERKAQRLAERSAFVGPSVHATGPGGDDSDTFAGVVDDGDDDALAAVVTAMGLYDDPLVVSEDASAALVAEVAAMAQAKLGDDVVIEHMPGPVGGAGAGTGAGAGACSSGAPSAAPSSSGEWALLWGGVTGRGAHVFVPAMHQLPQLRCILVVVSVTESDPDRMKVFYYDTEGKKVELDKRHLIAILLAFGNHVQKLSADKHTRIQQAAGLWLPCFGLIVVVRLRKHAMCCWSEGKSDMDGYVCVVVLATGCAGR
jgi:hypothetical protein